MDAPTQLPSPPPPSASQKFLLPGRSVMRALAAFVLAAGLLLGAYLHAYESALMDATRTVAQVGQSSAVRLSDLLSRADALSRNIASQTAGVQNSLATSATLIEMGRLIPQAHAVLLLSGTGKLLGSSQFLVHTEERPGDQAWFKAARGRDDQLGARDRSRCAPQW
jgi:small-conductance mechanosensitive channel